MSILRQALEQMRLRKANGNRGLMFKVSDNDWQEIAWEVLFETSLNTAWEKWHKKLEKKDVTKRSLTNWATQVQKRYNTLWAEYAHKINPMEQMVRAGDIAQQAMALNGVLAGQMITWLDVHPVKDMSSAERNTAIKAIVCVTDAAKTDAQRRKMEAETRSIDSKITECSTAIAKSSGGSISVEEAGVMVRAALYGEEVGEEVVEVAA